MVTITAHECLIVEHVRRTHYPRVTGALRDELESAGHYGLAQAAARYDETQHASFNTYAWRRVKGAMQDTMRDHDHLTRRDRQHATTGLIDDPGPPVPLTKAHERTLVDPDRPQDHVDAALTVDAAIRELPEREALVIRHIDLNGRTTIEVGRMLGVSGSRVSQLRARAHEHLRPLLREAA